MCKQNDEEALTEAGFEDGLKAKPLGESNTLDVAGAVRALGGVKECCLEPVCFVLEMGLELEQVVVMELRGVVVRLTATEFREGIGKLSAL